MDVLTEVLDSLRFKSGLFCRAHLSAPWGLHFSPAPCAVFHVVDRGRCWLQLEGGREPVALASGDFIMLPQGEAHCITDDLSTPAAIPVTIGKTLPLTCQTLDFTHGAAYTSLLCGIFDLEQSQRHPLIPLLPALIHIRGEQGHMVEWLDTTLKFLASETGSDRPGNSAVIKRLSDILFIQAIRYWMGAAPAGEGGWLRALRDPQISSALALMHRQPQDAWSVEGLAKEVAMSRSAFAARFNALVGLPPLRYLTQWRMHQVASRLARGERDLKKIAQDVGYESEFALSKAFKRQFGLPPREYRAAREHVVHGAVTKVDTSNL